MRMIKRMPKPADWIDWTQPIDYQSIAAGLIKDFRRKYPKADIKAVRAAAIDAAFEYELRPEIHTKWRFSDFIYIKMKTAAYIAKREKRANK